MVVDNRPITNALVYLVIVLLIFGVLLGQAFRGLPVDSTVITASAEELPVEGDYNAKIEAIDLIFIPEERAAESIRKIAEIENGAALAQLGYEQQIETMIQQQRLDLENNDLNQRNKEKWSSFWISMAWIIGLGSSVSILIISFMIANYYLKLLFPNNPVPSNWDHPNFRSERLKIARQVEQLRRERDAQKQLLNAWKK